MSKAKRLHKACITACYECPQFSGLKGGEYIDGKWRKMSKLHRNGLKAVRKYWNDPDTQGGDILHNYDYVECLSEEMRELLEHGPKINTNVKPVGYTSKSSLEEPSGIMGSIYKESRDWQTEPLYDQDAVDKLLKIIEDLRE